jgi:hypothetical protein
LPVSRARRQADPAIEAYMQSAFRRYRDQEASSAA